MIAALASLELLCKFRQMMVTKLRSAISTALEACGRHPLLTGLLALIGVFGTGFGVYDFVVSRAESEAAARTSGETQKIAADTRTGVEEVDRDLSDLDNKIEELGEKITIPPLIQNTNINDIPRKKFIYLPDDETNSEFVKFLGENKNKIVYLSIALPDASIRNLNGIMWFRQKSYFGDQEYDFVCYDMFFSDSDALPYYVGSDFGANGSTNIEGYFLTSTIRQSNAAALDCMSFNVTLLALSVADETTYIER